MPETIIIIETSAKIQLALGQEFMVTNTRTYGDEDLVCTPCV